MTTIYITFHYVRVRNRRKILPQHNDLPGDGWIIQETSCRYITRPMDCLAPICRYILGLWIAQRRLNDDVRVVMPIIYRMCRSTRPMTVSPPIDPCYVVTIWTSVTRHTQRRPLARLRPKTAALATKRLKYINSVLHIYQHILLHSASYTILFMV